MDQRRVQQSAHKCSHARSVFGLEFDLAASDALPSRASTLRAIRRRSRAGDSITATPQQACAVDTRPKLVRLGGGIAMLAQPSVPQRPVSLLRSVTKMVETKTRDAVSTSDGGGSGRSDTNDNSAQ